MHHRNCASEPSSKMPRFVDDITVCEPELGRRSEGRVVASHLSAVLEHGITKTLEKRSVGIPQHS